MTLKGIDLIEAVRRAASGSAVQGGTTSFEQLSEAHFAQILEDAPDVVILGTGDRQRFVHPKLTAALTMRRIGVECMDSQAACRTYNILMGEGRKVTLALILAPGAGQAK